MSARPLAEPAARPALPHWEQPPPDLPDAISRIKTALRERIAASGRTVEQVVGVVGRQLGAEVEAIATARERGETVWPVISYADIAAGTVSAAARELLRRRGCLVVRGHFDRDQAAGMGPGHRALRGRERVLRQLPRAGRRLLRQRGLEARDLPDLLVGGPDAGPAERPDGRGPGLPQQPVEIRLRRACAGSTRGAIRCIRTGFGAGRRAPTRAASAPTSIRARWTCG